MSIYAIADLHLSLGADKPMDIFPGWQNYVSRITENWLKLVDDGDTVVIAGDISWGMTLEQALPDFQLLQSLPGKKIMLKGNHDYWWNSAKKISDFFAANGLDSLYCLKNASVQVEGMQICGSRGWIFENGAAHDDKIINRECGRIEASLKSADGDGERLLFLHYPPAYGAQLHEAYFELMYRYGIKRCFYGHIHGAGRAGAVMGEVLGVRLSMISADYLNFCPLLVEK